MFKISVNNPAKISFGAMTGHIQSYGKIGPTNAGGIIKVRVTATFSVDLIPAAKQKIPNRWREYSISSQMR